jgi:hypothetical protein
MKELILKNNVVVLLDDDDYEWAISQGKWSYSITKQKLVSDFYYRVYNRNGKLHRQLLNVTDPKIQVDHINHNTLDNQRNNLRICTAQQNKLNTRKYHNTSSIYKGVGWNKSKQKWIAGCTIQNGKGKFLGYFESELEAALAYDNFVKTLPDVEFRVLNFPDKSL